MSPTVNPDLTDDASAAEEDGRASEDDFPLGKENTGSTEPGPEVCKQ